MTQEQMGESQELQVTWDDLVERAQRQHSEKIQFEMNQPHEVVFNDEKPIEMKSQMGDGNYYIFNVLEDGEEKTIMSGAYTFLKGVAALHPIKGKKARITKKMNNGRVGYEVVEIIK